MCRYILTASSGMRAGAVLIGLNGLRRLRNDAWRLHNPGGTSSEAPTVRLFVNRATSGKDNWFCLRDRPRETCVLLSERVASPREVMSLLKTRLTTMRFL